jgi:hypothetical protein
MSGGASLDDRLEAARPGALALAAATPVAPVPEPTAAGLDDATLAYVLAMREPFDLLRRAEGQLAGLLVLAAAGGRSAAGHPMLPSAVAAAREAGDAIRAVGVPRRARHHHHHLTQACRSIELALDAARRHLHRRDQEAFDASLAPLKLAHRHLHWATVALPGFELVAMAEACCAGHGSAAHGSAGHGSAGR